jgi:hypothetical protein
MHAVERLDAALALARQLGYKVRHEFLAGQPGGGCEIHGQRWLFVDLSLSPREQLEQVVETLRNDWGGILTPARRPVPGAAASQNEPQDEPRPIRKRFPIRWIAPWRLVRRR